jgi:putative aldouronate transport system substrate-binding protein
MMKVIRLSLAVAIILAMASSGLFAAGTGETESGNGGDYGQPGEFPLKETLTLRIGGGSMIFDPDENPLVQMMEEETNVHLEWVPMENEEKRNIVYASDSYPDMSGATGVWAPFITRMYDEGVIVDLVPYLSSGYTPNLDRFFEAYPDSYRYMLTPDGELLALAGFQMQRPIYLETRYMVNKTWLDRLGLEIPETTDELKDVLVAFRDEDPNQNGLADEIPFAFAARDGFARHPRSLYGWWGLPSKEPVTVVDGEILFTPMEPGYRAYIEYFADLYSEGLLDPESFTMNAAEMDAKVDNPEGNLIGAGVFSRGYRGTDEYPNRGEFVNMRPPQVPGGPPPEMWIHPGYRAIKNQWFMTDNNPEPEITMAWIDRFYTFEQSIQTLYGPIGEGVVYDETDGLWVPQESDDPDYRQKNAWPGTQGGATWVVIEPTDYGTRLALDATWAHVHDVFYEFYEDHIADEQWNRVEFSSSESSELSVLATDIHKIWQEHEARWITGAGDVSAEWDDYLEQLKNAGVERYIAIHQAAQDRFAGTER